MSAMYVGRHSEGFTSLLLFLSTSVCMLYTLAYCSESNMSDIIPGPEVAFGVCSFVLACPGGGGDSTISIYMRCCCVYSKLSILKATNVVGLELVFIIHFCASTRNILCTFVRINTVRTYM